MELQLVPFPFPVELQIISAFVLMIIGTEIIIVLLMHLWRNPKSGVALIRTCVIGVAAFVAMKSVEFTYLVFQGSEATSRETVYSITLVIIDLGCVALFATLRGFTRTRPALFGLVIPLLILLSSIIALLHVIELLTSHPGMILPRGVSVLFTAPLALGPAALVSFLYTQSDRAIKPYYLCIILSVVMLGIGGALHLVPVEDMMVLAGVNEDDVAVASMTFSVAGVSLFFVTLFMMPYIEDLYWQKEVVAVYVLNTSMGRIVFKHDFQSEGVGLEGNRKVNESDSVLMGGLSGMEDFVREMINDTGGNLEFIDKDGLKFILLRFKQYLFVTIARAYMPVIQAKLAEFKSNFVARVDEAKRAGTKEESYLADLVQAADRMFKGRVAP